jgi:hypothetical protein
MSQGIFISYRRDDSRLIAGRLYEALKAAFPKKKIFFDVDIPEPGNEIIAKIVRELQSSQVVIALIGPQWNAKNRLDSAYDFVRRELKSALDLRRNEGLKVLPILVDGAIIPAERLPADLIAMRELEYLEITSDGDIGKIVDGTRRLLPPYWVGSHDDIVRWRWDWVDFLKHLIKLDVDEVPTIDAAPRHPLHRLRQGVHRCLERLGLRNKDPGDEGTPEQWAVIFEHHPQTWRMVLDKNDDIIAYWHVAPLKAEDYGRLIAGRFKAGMVTYDRLTLFENKGGHYNLYHRRQQCAPQRGAVPPVVLLVFRRAGKTRRGRAAGLHHRGGGRRLDVRGHQARRRIRHETRRPARRRRQDSHLYGGGHRCPQRRHRKEALSGFARKLCSGRLRARSATGRNPGRA